VVEVGALMAERFLFAPSLGLALIAGALLSPLRKTRATQAAGIAVGMLISCLCIGGVIRSNSRAAEWRTAHSLWASYTAAAPNDARGWSSLGAVQLDRGEVVLARPSLERALELDPGGYPQQINNASLLIHEERYAEAEAAYRKMIATWPRVDQRVWLGLAKLDARAGRLDDARRNAIRALEIHPNFAETHRLIERIDSLLQQREAARGE
jgi:Flp pilus assembly protein TadD